MKRTPLKPRTTRLKRTQFRPKPGKRRTTFAIKPSSGYSPKDAAWSQAVKDRCGHRCMWPEGCRTGLRLQAHHGIRRDVYQHRHNPDNGLALCIAHHAEAESDPTEWKMTPSLMGDEWIAAGGWYQDGKLFTPGRWRRQELNQGTTS